MAVTVALDKHAKVLYGAHNLIVPFFFSGVVICCLFGDLTSGLTLFCAAVLFIISLIIALSLFFRGINSYRQFVQVDDKYLYICKSVNNSIHVVHKINREDIDKTDVGGHYGVFLKLKNGKKLKLMNCAPSLFLLILTVPFLSIPFMLLRNNMKYILRARIENALFIKDDNVQKMAVNAEKGLNGIRVFAWIFLAFMGLIGVLFGFLYSGVALLIAITTLFLH